MAARHDLRTPTSTPPAKPVLPNTNHKASHHGVVPPPSVTKRSTAEPRQPQVGESARLWNYVESEWIEGRIESIQSGYRVLVRCGGGLEETVGWRLALREGTWVEDTE
jgi:hypothetical protein